jgi:aldehyde dehydrogenase (NAD+)
MSNVQEVFQQQKNKVIELRNTTAKERISWLKTFKANLLAAREEFQEAMAQDFRKPAAEVDLTELVPLISEINFYCKNLKSWMKPKKVGTPLFYIGTSSKIKFESKGRVLIISPWNYPINLSLMPVVAAIAAGNAVILKPSEFTPHTNKVISKVISQTFKSDHAIVMEGEVELAQELLALPFDHMFFTGSTNVGRIVMQAAAKVPCPVTLELGGKSPAFVDDEVDMKDAVSKLAWGKWLNASQTCIAPDYILIAPKHKNQFVQLLTETIAKFNGRSREDFGGIVHQGHFDRLKKMVQEVKEQGSEVIELTAENAEERRFPFTLVLNPSLDSQLMKEEIFGPILPILTKDSLQERIDVVNSFPPPLSLYVFSQNKKHIKQVLDQCQAGGTTVNDTIYHLANHCLPFGGVTHSGIGKYHGRHGFEELSHHRAVMTRHFGVGLSFFYPPYNERVRKLIDFMMKKLTPFF